MALTLRSAITATETTIDVTGTDALLEGDIRQVDDEQIEVRTAYYPAGQGAYQRLGVLRGVEGTRKAAHAAAASLSTPSSGGGTSTLAEVLAEENVTGEATIVTPSGTIDGTVGFGQLNLNGKDGGVAASGVAAGMQGGAGNDFAAYGGYVNANPGTADGHGGGVNIGTSGPASGSGFDGADIVLGAASGDGAGRHGLVIIQGASLPTADPEVAGALWSDSGVVTVSAG